MTAMLTPAAAFADPNLLGAALGDDHSSWSAWITILKAAYAEPLDDDERAIFDKIAGGREPPKERVKELWIAAGRRSGKTRIAGGLAVHGTALTEVRLAPGERGRALTLAVSKDQAGHCREYARAFLKSSPLLAQRILDESAERISLKGNLSIEAHASSFRSVRGGTLLIAVMDEAAYWRDENSAAPDKEVYRALRPSLMTTGGLLVGISSPYRRSGLLYEKYGQCFGKDDPRVLVVQAATTLLNPTIDRSEIEAELAADPEAARSEWLAEFRDDLSDLFRREALEAVVDYGRYETFLHPGPRYAAFVDPSGGSQDSMTLAVSHKDGERVVLDLVREVVPPFSPADVVEEFCGVLSNAGITRVHGDRYAGGHLRIP